MIRPLTLLTALALAAPLPALAQTYPASATVAMGVRDLQPANRLLAMDEQTVPAATAPEPPQAEPPRADLAQPSPLKIRSVDPDDIPAVRIRAKEAWSDDQGLRFNYTNVRFKQRF